VTVDMPAELQDAGKYTRRGVEGWLLRRFRWGLLQAVAGARPATVLDAGCGEGFVTEWLRGALPEARIAGVDLSEAALARAARRVPEAELRTGDLHALPYPDAAFDLVVCTEVLEHVEVPETALRELLRVSRGQVLVTVPHEPFFRLGNLARGRHLRRLGSTPGHRWTWSRRGLLRLPADPRAVERWISLFPWQAMIARARR
jgi:2-polyprenyl-3-methyl-5-hydroxy-6-metoxy-1,4-benzoquinol methylase